MGIEGFTVDMTVSIGLDWFRMFAEGFKRVQNMFSMD